MDMDMVENTMEETIYKPILAVARQRPVLAGDVVIEGSLQQKSSQKIVIKTWANSKEFTLDHIFPSDTTQSEIFDSLINPLVRHTLRGFTGLAVLYGQTGSGKSYTLFGKDPAELKYYRDSNIGQLPRALLSIFEYLTAQHLDYDVSVSFLEVHNDIPRDLLAKADPWGDDEDKKQLKCLDDITEAVVTNYEHFNNMFCLAQKDQEYANLDRRISEVSNVYMINITKVSIPGTQIEQMGKLVFVELAGGENFGAFDEMERLGRQLIGTRKTIYALNKVIQALNTKEQTVPYMDSKLTRILKEILNPNCQIAIIATISPCAWKLQETANTLDYAERLRFEIPTKDLQLPEPAAPRIPILSESGLDLDILVLKTEQMRIMLNNMLEGEIVNFEPQDCIINNVDDLYDAIQIMESECLYIHHNYNSASMQRPDQTGDWEVEASKFSQKQRYIESILDPLAKWKNRINFLVTNYKVTSAVRDFRLRFKVEKINHPTVLFHPFNKRRMTEEIQISAKIPESSENPRAELGAKVMKTSKPQTRAKKTKRLFTKKQVETIQLVDEPMMEEEKARKVAQAGTTSDVKPSQPMPKEKSTVTLDIVGKKVQNAMTKLEELREEFKTLWLE